MTEDGVECKSFTLVSIDFILFYESKYYLQVYLDNCTYIIDLSERIDFPKSNNSKECIFCHYWYFDYAFKLQNSVCNGFHDLTMLCRKISNIAIITVKNVDYRCINHDISRSDDRGYI